MGTKSLDAIASQRTKSLQPVSLQKREQNIPHSSQNEPRGRGFFLRSRFFGAISSVSFSEIQAGSLGWVLLNATLFWASMRLLGATWGSVGCSYGGGGKFLGKKKSEAKQRKRIIIASPRQHSKRSGLPMFRDRCSSIGLLQIETPGSICRMLPWGAHMKAFAAWKELEMRQACFPSKTETPGLILLAWALVLDKLGFNVWPLWFSWAILLDRNTNTFSWLAENLLHRTTEQPTVSWRVVCRQIVRSVSFVFSNCIPRESNISFLCPPSSTIERLVT